MTDAAPEKDHPPTASNAALPELEPLQSMHTHSFPKILMDVACSLAVSTYQAGRLVLLRAEQGADGPALNSHFRAFNKPMGLAWEHGRMAIGTAAEIWEFHDIPSVTQKSKTPESPTDAAFLPRTVHFTGDIQIHEMAWVPAPPPASAQTSPPPELPNLSTLWFINTRFSCLCTRSGIYSFVPRWKPRFITALAPEDRCHLNGFGLKNGILQFATALGRTDTPGGWRDNKRSGGVLMDIPTNQIIATGLSMPHSPRWYEGRLWVLDSGNGGIGIVDPSSGRYQEVCRLPGFTRGLDFIGPYAFVGLSQIRESATFSGIAIAELKPEDRACGIWIVDIRTGQIAGYVKFTNAVQEIFAVQVLSGIKWPDLITSDTKQIAGSFELAGEALQQVPAAMRSS